MKVMRASESVALALGIVASGVIPFTAFYLLGLHVWAWVGLGVIPFGFGYWRLSSVLAGYRNREICANLTVSEREQATAMEWAFGRKMALWQFGGMGLVLLPVFWVLLTHPGGAGLFDDLARNQFWLVAVGLALVVALVLVWLPAGIKHRRAMRDFLRETEYAKRTRQAGHAL